MEKRGGGLIKAAAAVIILLFIMGLLICLLLRECERAERVAPAPRVVPERERLPAPIEETVREKIEAAAEFLTEPDGIRPYIAAFSASGEKEWEKIIDGKGIEWAEYAAENDDGIIICIRGLNPETMGQNISLAQADNNGEILWRRSFSPGSREEPPRVEMNGGTLMTGTIMQAETGNFESYIALINTEGSFDWLRNFGAGYHEWGYVTIAAEEGYYITAGEMGDPGMEGDDMIIVKNRGPGSPEWIRRYGGDDFDAGYYVHPGSDGGFIIAGKTFSFGAGRSDMFIVKADSEGSPIWQKAIGGEGYEAAYCVKPYGSGYIAAGVTDSKGSGGYDAYVVILDGEGNILDEIVFGGPGNDAAYSVFPRSGGGFITAGFTETPASRQEGP